MRIVLDTNVLISGTFWSGDSFKILQYVNKGEVTLLLSKETVWEYDKVVRSEEIITKEAYQLERVAAVQKLFQLAAFVEPLERIEAVEDDPDDNKFIELAVAGGATCIVSQDKHLLHLKEFRRIEMLTPKEFLIQFEQREKSD